MKRNFIHLVPGIPLFLLFAIGPLIGRCHIYQCQEPFLETIPIDQVYTDFFSYWKSVFFFWICLAMLVLLLVLWLRRIVELPERKLLLFLGACAAVLVLSDLSAVNPSMAIWGGYQRFEGLFTELGYLVCLLYVYTTIRIRSCRKLLLAGIFLSAAAECVIGLFQLAGNDPVFWEAFRYILLPDGYRDAVMGSALSDSRVYLTLANPNYASIYLALVLILVLGCLYYLTLAGNQSGRIVKKCPGQKSSRIHMAKLIILAVLGIACLIDLVGTRSRVGLLMLAAAGIFLLISSFFARSSVQKKIRRRLLIIILIALGIIMLADAAAGFQFSKKMVRTSGAFLQDGRNCHLDDLQTGTERISFRFHRIEAEIFFEKVLRQENLRLVLKGGQDISDRIDQSTGKVSFPGLEEIALMAVSVNDEPMLLLDVEGTDFYFSYDEAEGWLIYVGNDCYDKVRSVPAVDFHGMEHLASGRLYVWSRTIPLVADDWMTGYGDDNFVIVFPQHDYLGKAGYCSSPYTIVEKPHNTFLLLAVEHGMPALLLFILANIWFFVRIRWENRRNRIFLSAAMLACLCAFFFNDSSVVFTPAFCMILGAGLRKKTQGRSDYDSGFVRGIRMVN